MECAAVIGKRGRDIAVSEADDYITGFMIMNDFSARVLQMQEMKLNLGPAKGKDFGSSFGPWLVTKDELENNMERIMRILNKLEEKLDKLFEVKTIGKN